MSGTAVSAAAPALPSAEDPGRPLMVSTDLPAGRVTVTGELDRASAHHLLDVFESLPLGDQHTWVVDAAGITFCDVEGLRVLARAQALARTRGRALLLVHPRPFLMYSLVLVGMQHIVDQAPPGTVRGRSARRVRDRAGSPPRQRRTARR